MDGNVAGVVVGLDNELYFVPAGVAEGIVQRPVVTRVPGTAIGMALIGGRIVPVIDLSPRREELLVCDVDGEPLALSGLAVHGTGFYPREDDGVRVDGELLRELDVKSAVRRAEHELWSTRRA